MASTLVVADWAPKFVLSHLREMRRRALESTDWEYAGIFERVDSIDSRVPPTHWVYRCARDPEEERIAVPRWILEQLSDEGYVRFTGPTLVTGRMELVGP